MTFIEAIDDGGEYPRILYVFKAHALRIVFYENLFYDIGDLLERSDDYFCDHLAFSFCELVDLVNRSSCVMLMQNFGQ